MEKWYSDLSDPRNDGTIDGHYYRAPTPDDWQGRNDGLEPEHRRWHQVVRTADLTQTTNMDSGAFVLLGFACDEGVRRNQGRTGAEEGPAALRRALANLPCHDADIAIWDAGDIVCPAGNLEAAQEQLGLAVAEILRQGGRPIVLGGGHEVTFGHYLGLERHRHRNAVPDNDNLKLGLINFDAHFDNREPGIEGPSSGTGFWQIAQRQASFSDRFPYLAIGIQPAANTRALFDRADKAGTTYITAGELRQTPPYQIPQKLETFLSGIDQVYLTVDLDVFAAAYAPGVSAATPLGLHPDQTFFNCLDTILASGKLLSVDVAELNPSLDHDHRTAKLAAALIFHIIEK